MKRDPEDWNVEDVDFAIARQHGYTLQQIMSMDFPAADYTGEDGALYWRNETVVAWLERFHAAMHVVARASDPAGFDRFVQSLRDLMQKGVADVE